MTETNRARRLLVVSTAFLLLAGCTGEEEASNGAPPTATTSSASPSPTPTHTEDPAPTTTEPPTLSPEEQDQANVEATVLAYSAALSEVFQGGDVEEIYPWSRDVAREQWVTQTLSYRDQGLVIAGETPVEVLEVDLSDDQANVLACVDYSKTSVTDADGKDITPDRASGDLILNDYVLEREPSTEYGWIVVDDASRSEPCGD